MNKLALQVLLFSLKQKESKTKILKESLKLQNLIRRVQNTLNKL